MKRAALYIAVLLTFFAVRFGSDVFYLPYIPHKLILISLYIWVAVVGWLFYFMMRK
ncbi:hypothetical protein SAMN04244560_00144 [Thermoanaerobacter thermohydrosulfuricus]|uniref:Uncharacterized protein n=1 Tax=Thermoanaerobacter thermohydrosulfuricus TaxID=1516 RepID=A0A1G7HSR3_THETY|nr:hypothetical protein SAMN04244560_00144 [Thermoanaerobacter thermohydrosulfuricus]HHY79156.1 hypothetical protein [Thermoanaerobacter sp.]